MPATYTPAVFLREFNDIYRTLDVRVATIKDGEQWVLVALSVRLRISDPKIAKEEFESLCNQFGRVNGPSFRIVQKCVPFDESPTFFELMSRGNLVIGDLSIRLSSPEDVLLQAGHPRIDYEENMRWPSINVQRQIDKNERVLLAFQNDAGVLRDSELAGYEYPYTAVKKLLDVDYSQSTSAGVAWIECDMPMRLLTPFVARHGNELELQLRAQSHEIIRNAECAVRHIRGDGSRVIRQSVVHLVRSKDIDEGIASWTGTLRIAMQREDDLLTLEALAREVGSLYSTRITPFTLLPRQQANPLLTVLEAFCAPAQIRLLLEEPQKAQVDALSMKNPARIFEISTQWLMSALGFRAIWLHSFEKIKDGNMELGTVDCLAYSEKDSLLLLVNCSLAAPDPSELHRQENLTTWLQMKLFRDAPIAVHAALFTAAHRPKAQEDQRYGSAVRVFFKEDVAELLDAARAGGRLSGLVPPRQLLPWG